MRERTSECSGGREQSEQSGASGRVSGASERTSERTSEWPSTYVSILVCSRPHWALAEKKKIIGAKPYSNGISTLVWMASIEKWTRKTCQVGVRWSEVLAGFIHSCILSFFHAFFFNSFIRTFIGSFQAFLSLNKYRGGT